MKSNDEIRETVSRTYAQAVNADAQSGCCGAAPKGTLAKIAGYDATDIDDLPAEAVTNSLGCGNPLAFANVRPGDVVLDLGAGAGIDVVLAARKVGPTGRAIGVDMTDEMITRARAAIADADLTNAEVRKGLIEDLPVEDDSVDWIISNCVINLSPEKPRVFAEMMRVLKPGGRLLVSDVIAENLPENLREDLKLYACCVAGALSESGYRAGLMQAGFVDIEIHKRLELSAAQVTQIVENELSAAEETGGCCGGAAQSKVATCCAEAAETARVWAAEISARRPE